MKTSSRYLARLTQPISPGEEALTVRRLPSRPLSAPQTSDVLAPVPVHASRPAGKQAARQIAAIGMTESVPLANRASPAHEPASDLLASGDQARSTVTNTNGFDSTSRIDEPSSPSLDKGKAPDARGEAILHSPQRETGQPLASSAMEPQSSTGLQAALPPRDAPHNAPRSSEPTSPRASIHIGTIEVRSVARTNPLPPPATPAAPALRAVHGAPQSIARPLSWRYGLVQG